MSFSGGVLEFRVSSGAFGGACRVEFLGGVLRVEWGVFGGAGGVFGWSFSGGVFRVGFSVEFSGGVFGWSLSGRGWFSREFVGWSFRVSSSGGVFRWSLSGGFSGGCRVGLSVGEAVELGGVCRVGFFGWSLSGGVCRVEFFGWSFRVEFSGGDCRVGSEAAVEFWSFGWVSRVESGGLLRVESVVFGWSFRVEFFGWSSSGGVCRVEFSGGVAWVGEFFGWVQVQVGRVWVEFAVCVVELSGWSLSGGVFGWGFRVEFSGGVFGWVLGHFREFSCSGPWKKAFHHCYFDFENFNETLRLRNPASSECDSHSLREFLW